MGNPINMRDSKDRQNEVYMSLWTRKKGQVWGFKGKEGNSQEEWKE